jgi:Holliday junction DNA helicase RuvA
MISQLSGILIEKSSTHAVIDCGGVGYSAFISVKTSEKLPEKGQKAVLLTHLIPREDALNLFGFSDQREREAFRLLISVSGIGPKIALGILSSVSIDELATNIIGGNLPALQKLPGIGKKSAERLNLELRDKMLALAGEEADTGDGEVNMIKQEAVAALTTLGYPASVAKKSVDRAGKELPDGAGAEELIKNALRFAMK